MGQYNGSIELISGIVQANHGDFPLVDASAVQVNDNGQRLDGALSDIIERLDNIDVSGGITDVYTKAEIDQKLSNITSSGVDISEEDLNNMLLEVLG